MFKKIILNNIIMNNIIKIIKSSKFQYYNFTNRIKNSDDLKELLDGKYKSNKFNNVVFGVEINKLKNKRIKSR